MEQSARMQPLAKCPERKRIFQAGQLRSDPSARAIFVHCPQSATPSSFGMESYLSSSLALANQCCIRLINRAASFMTLELLEACRGGDEAQIIELLKHAATDVAYQDGDGISPMMVAAAGGMIHIVTALLNQGAPWNAVDRRGWCAGDYAAEAGHEQVFEAVVEAGCRAELLLAAIERKSSLCADPLDSYLRQSLHYDSQPEGQERLLDAESKAVMMSWEGALMQAHAAAICSRGGDVLNIGFGLGMVDEAIHSHQPRSHTIVEAHPDVHKRMLERGWNCKAGVKIVFGRWQDVLSQLDKYDGIFFDTYSEYYEDLRQFHAALPKLLKPTGIYSFFNGLAADNATFHTVYCRIVAGELARLNLHTQFIALPINIEPDTWQGVENRYWQLDTYQLPVCQWDSES